jgi:hypothetical protein
MREIVVMIRLTLIECRCLSMPNIGAHVKINASNKSYSTLVFYAV